MRVLFALTLSLLSLVSNARSLQDLGAERAQGSFQEVLAGLGDLNEDTLPHEAKELRKQLGELRDLLDLFAAIFPDKVEGSPRGKDIWVVFRKDLDRGYETMGAFKDLFDSQNCEIEDAVYPQRETKRRRKALLDWTEDFLENDTLKVYRRVLRQPRGGDFYEHDLEDQSRFYWGGAGLEPDPTLEGLANLRRLAGGLLNKARGDYEGVFQINDLTDFHDAEVFHDFRKRIRSVMKIGRLFPDLLPTGGAQHPAVLTLEELVERYGQINDQIVAYGLENDDDDRRDLRREIKRGFEGLLQWQRAHRIDRVIEDLRAAL